MRRETALAPGLIQRSLDVGWDGHVDAPAAGDDPLGADHLLEAADVGSDVAGGEGWNLGGPGPNITDRGWCLG
eukprot:11389437-Alexandrium_andersonii.AAC.1